MYPCYRFHKPTFKQVIGIFPALSKGASSQQFCHLQEPSSRQGDLVFAACYSCCAVYQYKTFWQGCIPWLLLLAKWLVSELTDFLTGNVLRKEFFLQTCLNDHQHASKVELNSNNRPGIASDNDSQMFPHSQAVSADTGMSITLCSSRK